MVDETNPECVGCENEQEAYDHGGKFTVCKKNLKNSSECLRRNRCFLSCKLLSHTPNPVAVIEQAAAMCYDSVPDGSGKLLKGCYKSGHHSVFEHVSFTFEVSGVSRTLLAQITRHRFASFSVRSQRYCTEDAAKFVYPPKIVASERLCKAFSDSVDKDLVDYKQQVASESLPEDARFLLPGACETKFVVTMNFRELMHFCNLRLCNRAQWEIRNLAKLMKELVSEVAPALATYLVPQCEKLAPYNFCTERQCCGKYPKLKEVYEKYLSNCR